MNITNLILKPNDVLYISHGVNKSRSILKAIKSNKGNVYILKGSNDKLPGGYSDFKKQKIPYRKNKKTYADIVRSTLKKPTYADVAKSALSKKTKTKKTMKKKTMKKKTMKKKTKTKSKPLSYADIARAAINK